MKRFHLFEIEDQKWLPKTLRNLITDVLQYQLTSWEVYKPIVPKLKRVLEAIDCHHITDLCSGSGATLRHIQEMLATQEQYPVSITLTDKYPHIDAFVRIQQGAKQPVDFVPKPIDATAVPADLTGFRTLFTAFHHFRPPVAKKIIQDAVDKEVPIGIFEFTERTIPNVLIMIFVVPIMVLLQTPFMRPFTWSRLFWTYIIPLVPLFYAWDGLVSHLRTYTPDELEALVGAIEGGDYKWEIDRLPTEKVRGVSVTYLIGYPVEATTPSAHHVQSASETQSTQANTSESVEIAV